MSAIDIALRTARRYGKQEGGEVAPQVSEEDIERARMNQANAPREGGLLQTIPQFVQQMQTPEGRGKLWESTKQALGPALPGNLISGVKEMVQAPGEAMTKGMTPEQEAEWGANVAMAGAGSHMPFAGEGQIGVFGGKGSPFHNSEALEQARSMDHRNVKADVIYERTGWFKDKETGEWAFHIPMNQSQLHPDIPKHPDDPSKVWLPPNVGVTLPRLLQDPMLYQHYPFLNDWKVIGRDSVPELNLKGYGSLHEPTKQIIVSPQAPETLHDTLVHEVNHAIQSYENFATGSNWRRYVPAGFEQDAAELQGRIGKMDDWISQFAKQQKVPEDAVHAAIQNGLRNPDLMEPWHAGIIKNMMKVGKFDDIVALLSEAERFNQLKQSAMDKYWTSLGEVRSREAEWRRKLTPEESRAIPPSAAQQMMEMPVPPGQEYIGRGTGDFSALSEARPAEGLPQQDELGFHSKADAIVSKGPEETTPHRWLDMLRKQGMKPEEDEWMGLTKWLNERKGQNISKADLQNFIRSNRQKFGEYESKGSWMPEGPLPEEWGGNPPTIEEMDRQWQLEQEFAHGNFHDDITEMPPEMQEEAFAPHPDDYGATTKYSNMVIPGGTDYKELKYRWFPKDIGGWQFSHEHFPEVPNLLGHIRTDARDIDGLNTMHIHELQSDWHQQGRKLGYKEPVPDWTNPNRQEVINKNTIAAPNAPLKQVWPQFLMKRAIRYAIDNGFDQISWPGAAKTIQATEQWPGLRQGEKGSLFTTGAQPKNVTSVINRYVRDLPQFLDKLGEPFGLKTGDSITPGAGLPVKTFKLTPEFKAHVLKHGFEQFKRGGRVATKMTKKATHYRPGYGIRVCAKCTMFRAPSSCTAVAGTISPKALCDLFKRKKGA